MSVTTFYILNSYPKHVLSIQQGEAPFQFKTEQLDSHEVQYKDSRSNSTNTVVTTAQVHHPNEEVNLEQVSGLVTCMTRSRAIIMIMMACYLISRDCIKLIIILLKKTYGLHCLFFIYLFGTETLIQYIKI